MEFKVEQQKASPTCSTCPMIDEWRVEVTINGNTTVSMYGYDPTEELTVKQAAFNSGELGARSGFIDVPKCENKTTWQLVTMDEANAILDELNKEAVTNSNQLEIDALTAKLEGVTDKKERTKIKNRIQYLKRFV